MLTHMADQLTRAGPAKINLMLRVLGRRADGYHDIESLVARVALHDTITVSSRADGRITLRCDDPSIPTDAGNLAVQAAESLRGLGETRYGADIVIAKRIPAGAGLGGGSSNAATTLELLNDLWEFRLPRADLIHIGEKIGVDVPLFFHTPMCIVRGRGDEIEDVAETLDGFVVLLLPAIHCPTAPVYAAWDELAGEPHRSAPESPPLASESQPSAPEFPPLESKPAAPRPSAAEILDRRRDGQAWTSIWPLLYNDLAPAARRVSPPLDALMTELARLPEGPPLMTGSGSVLFRLFGDRDTAEAYAERVREATGVRSVVVPPATVR